MLWIVNFRPVESFYSGSKACVRVDGKLTE